MLGAARVILGRPGAGMDRDVTQFGRYPIDIARLTQHDQLCCGREKATASSGAGLACAFYMAMHPQFRRTAQICHDNVLIYLASR
jgi:hypothetical protein